MKFIYLDCESTGLNPTKHWAWEVAWAVNDGPAKHAYLPHSLDTADREALEVNHYWERSLREPAIKSTVSSQPAERAAGLVSLRDDLRGAILVGANPGFDVGMLTTEKVDGPAPLHLTDFYHRHIDVRTQAMVMLGKDYPMGLASTVALLRDMYDLSLIPEPDHTAIADVEAVRAVHTAVRSWRSLLNP